jgi:hypothetical protein
MQISVSATVQTSGCISRRETELVAGMVGDTLREAVAVATDAARNQRSAGGPEKEVPMSESSGPGSPGVYAPHVRVDANRGTNVNVRAADQRDAKNETKQ